MKTLYLSYDGMTDPLGQSQVIPYLEGLAKQGYQITLVSFEKQERAGRKPVIAAQLQQAGIYWQPLPYTLRPPVISTIKDIARLYKVLDQLLAKEAYALVHCRGYITAMAGLRLKKKYGLKFLFDMRGFFADERVEGGLWNLKNPVFLAVYKYFKRLEKAFFKEADHTISLTHKGRQIIHQQFGSIPITVIPCCADNELFSRKSVDEEKAESIRQQLEIEKDAMVVAYLGSIGTWYMLPEMLQFFYELLKRHPDAVMLFITREANASIMAEAAQQGVPAHAIRVIGAHREELPNLLSLATFSLFFIRPVFSKQASSPTKQGELMSMGIPVVCNAGVGDTDWVIDKYQSGYCLPSCNTEAYQAAIAQIPALIGLDAEKIRHGAIAFYSLEKGVEAYQNVYEKLIGKP